MKAATILLLTVAGFALGQHVGHTQTVTVRIVAPPGITALCDTDTDCARLCPPGDADCDGGPQQANQRRAGF